MSSDMFDINFNVGGEEFSEELLAKFSRTIVYRALELTALEVLRNVKIKSPVDHGALATSWQLEERSNEDIFVISTDKYYALFLHTGTGQYFDPPDDGRNYDAGVGGPYIIEPINKQALYWKGAEHPVKRVVHPGIPRNPYITESFSEAKERTEEFMVRALRETLGDAS